MPYNSLTPRARELLVLLTERGDWMTRAELAKRLDKPRLSAYDVTQLEILEGKRWVEMRHNPATVWSSVFEYKVSSRDI